MKADFPLLDQQRSAVYTAVALAFLAALPILLFRYQVFGDLIWLGNADRLNSNLKILTFFARSIAGGQLATWNEHEMMGYDSFVLPYTFPSPFAWLAASQGTQLIAGAGFMVPILLVAGGWASYVFLRSLSVSHLAAVSGSALYELAALPVLKVSQNDLSYLVIVFIPLLLLCIRRSDTFRPLVVVSLCVLLALMLHGMFLQKAAYVLLLIVAYATWRSARIRNWTPIVTLAIAGGCALIFAAPRLLGIMQALGEYARVTNGWDLTDFNALYNFQNIRPYEIFRWLDGTIFGISPSDAARLGNNINLTEGFLLSSSALVPAILVIGIVRYRERTFSLVQSAGRDTAFWLWTLAATVAVIIWKDAQHLVFLAFQRLDFTHARILVVGLLPMAALLALVLDDRRPVQHWNPRIVMIGTLVGLVLLVGIETVVSLLDGEVRVNHIPYRIRLDAIWRIGLTLVTLAGLMTVQGHPKLSPTYSAAAYMALVVLLIGQTFAAADLQVNGPQTRHAIQPFFKGDMYYADKRHFRLPDAAQIETLQNRLNNNQSRVVLVCNPTSAGGFCAGHVPVFWQLRAVDGYYGLGVPRRLIALPWNGMAALRTISFTKPEDLPWPLLGLLNVGSALIVTPEIYRNAADDGTPADPSHATILPNPAPVVPRVFLVASADPAADAADAAARLFDGDKPRDVQTISLVEGLPKPATYDSSGSVTLHGSGDRLEIAVEPSARSRLVVLNDLYFPNWHATVDGREIAVYPTNVVMRGMILPPGTRQVVLEYQTATQTTWASVARVVAIILIFVATLLGWRLQRRDKPQV